MAPIPGVPQDELVAIINEDGLFTQSSSAWVWPPGARAETGMPIHGPFVVARWTYDGAGDDHAGELTRTDLATISGLFPSPATVYPVWGGDGHSPPRSPMRVSLPPLRDVELLIGQELGEPACTCLATMKDAPTMMTTTTVSCRHYLTTHGSYPGLVDADHLLRDLETDAMVTVIVEVTAPDRRLLVRQVDRFRSVEEGAEGVRRLESEGLHPFFAEDHAAWAGKNATRTRSQCGGWLDVEALEGS